MALFKRKKEPSFAKATEGKENKEAEKREAKVGLPQGKDPRFYKIIEKPVVTEKAVNSSGKNKYVFRVWQKTNKVEVKKAIEKLYDVKVKDVRIINTLGKKRQVGRFEGWKPGFKKAVVTLEKGYTIEVSHA
ncbi:MAG: 50S ribosomal protein L23 [Patescibacteria group bacterium]